ncbi:MAG TPA: pilus assembly protein PilA [Bdellovibrionales bacterium]|nr:pilus assembly protein PilA [Pseudobdellovibrionaceae bacterium]HAG90686.1 pilus assembly protein PilA [Bdellovibrionales bacterium]|tara:strand:+ start:813 stop:1430 length:618 start_codon:yes stop_codon:yes gene_type:complete
MDLFKIDQGADRVASIKANGKSNQKGFSLIELMVVVGIIGILAAIAVPNFQKFQAKSRQSEAKANLGGLYTAQKAFYAEWNRFFTDFRHIGFAPEGVLRYHVGFSAAGGAIPANSGYTGPNCLNPAAACPAQMFNSAIYCPITAGLASTCTISPFAVALSAGTVPANGQSFIAQASGNVDADATVDRWTIDQGKNLINTSPDLVD